MAQGAAATIKAYVPKNKIAHPKARKTSVTSQNVGKRLAS